MPGAHAGAGLPDPVRLLGVGYLGDLPTLVAREEGLFGQRELRVDAVRGQSGMENLRALRAGDAEFALMAPTPLVLDRLTNPAERAGDEPVILASLVHTTHLNHVVTLTDTGIRHPHQLPGRRVGLMAGTNSEFLWWLFAPYHRFSPTAVELVDLPVEELGDALAGGRIDAAVLWEPWTSRLARRFGNRLHHLPGGDIYTEKWVLVTTRRIAREHTELCRRVLAAYQEAITRIEERPDSALGMYAEDAGLTGEPEEGKHEAAFFTLTLDWSLLTTLQQQVEWARHSGRAAPQPQADTDILSWIATGPLRDLAPEAVSIPASTANTARSAP